ncbi:hypothetical protein FBEOM_3424 [Fusarium beomiforme]|uniref:BTB domain-containing protein n=1 Tax=Fusarium beomiforme TaxID=44412 RepID=A0A9P5APN9_9HYPO|nr:hypothetical protein FBEOM_3424 [Fusarium beomiforme]
MNQGPNIGEGAVVTIYFGSYGGHGPGVTGVEYVHTNAIDQTCPQFLLRFTEWGILQVPPAPRDARTAIVRFLYTGVVPFYEVTEDSTDGHIQDAFGLALHVYSQAVNSDIPKMKDQATQYLQSLFPYMAPTEMLSYTWYVLEPLYHGLRYEWVEVQAALEHPQDDLVEITTALEAEHQAELQRTVDSRMNKNDWVMINLNGEEEKEEEEELKVVDDDGLINLDMANYPPGVHRW